MTFKKFFIAIVIPEPGFAAIEAIKESLYDKFGLKGALRSPAHITLHRPFEWREDKEHLLVEKLQQFKYQKQFDINLKDYGFFEPRVIYINVLTNEELSKLHRDLTLFAKSELKLFNEADDLRGFHPHVTVAFRDLKKPMFYQLQQKYLDDTFNFAFKVEQLSILKLEKTWQVFHRF